MSHRNRIVAIALVATVFVVGVLAGVVGTHVYYAKRFTNAGSIADAALEISARRMTRQLDLREDQQQIFEEILGDTRLEIDALRREATSRLRDIRDDSAERLIEVLDEEQLKKLEEMRAEQGRLFDEYLK